MTSFLFATENVAAQRQNVRRDLKKRWRKKAERLSWRFRATICLFLVCAVQEKCFNYSKTIILIFGSMMTLLTLDSVVSRLGMTSLAAC